MSEDRESILYEFALEDHERGGVLTQYLKLYPDLAPELIDLSAELRFDREMDKLNRESSMLTNHDSTEKRI